MIHFGKIKKTYNGKVVLNINDFSIEEKKIYVITGKNGSGKTTLAKIIAGIMIDDTNRYKNLLLKVGYTPQKPYIFDLTLEKNILINGNDKNKCEKLIEAFSISYLKNKKAKSFSSGEQQKLALARFMMKDYDIAILDEPTSAMDLESQKRAEDIMLNYAKGKTLIVITHDKSQMNKIADVVITIDNAKII